MTYKQIIDSLIKERNFSFSRWGDGEINAILGSPQPHNCDKHQYFKDMGMRLLKVIKSKPEYIMGLQNLVQRTRKDDPDFQELIEGIDWVDSDVLHRQSIKHGLKDLFQALQTRNIILVANENLQEVASMMYSPDTYPLMHIIISPVDSWLEYDDVLKRVLNIVHDDDVILYASGMMTEVLIDDVYNIYQGDVTQIDVGSLFDPYCGIKSRSYMKNKKFIAR